MNPLRAYQENKYRKQLAADLYATLRKRRPAGLDLPNDPQVIGAVLILLKNHPQLTVIQTGRGSRTLYFKADIDPVVSPGQKELMDRGGIFVSRDNLEAFRDD